MTKSYGMKGHPASHCWIRARKRSAKLLVWTCGFTAVGRWGRVWCFWAQIAGWVLGPVWIKLEPVRGIIWRI